MNEPTQVLIDRFAQAGGWQLGFLLLLIGGAFALGQAPFGLVFLAFAAMCIALFIGVATLSPRQAAKRGWLIGVGFSLVTFNWIVEPFLVDLRVHGWMAPFALALMAGIGGLFWAAAFWLGRRIAPQGGMSAALTVALSLCLSEIVRSYAFTGFPWALSAYIWVDTPVYHLARIVGPHGVTLATWGLAAAIVSSVLRRSIGLTLVNLGLLMTIWITGGLLQRADDLPMSERPVVRLVQPNAPQHQKWDRAMIPVFYDRLLGFTARQAERQPDLIIWPEVAVPFLLNDPTSPLWEISDTAKGVPVILGGLRLEDRRAYNSLAVLGNGGEIEQVYDKHHLVPFGEYIPGEWLFSRIGLKALTAKHGYGYSAGPGPALLELGSLGLALPLICYESIFPHEMRRVEARPDWMLILTNDAWFGDLIGPYQHFAQAKARAIEFSLPMVRVANTGVSAVFDGKGRVIGSLPLGQQGFLDLPLPPALKAGLYWKTGDSPAIIAVIVLLLALYLRGREKRLTRP